MRLWEYHDDEPRTPFSNLRIEDAADVAFLDLDEALLVVRGKVDGKEVEIRLGDLDTSGDRNGMRMLCFRDEPVEIVADCRVVKHLPGRSEYRLLVDCEVHPDPRSGTVWTVVLRDEQK